MKYPIICILFSGFLFFALSQFVLAQQPATKSNTFECDYATDIDQDDDGLIEICSLEGLNAIRYQPDGTGYRTSTDMAKITTGCKAGGCNGYELTRDLDFNDDVSYGSTANKVIYTAGDGWQPIGDYTNEDNNNSFTGIFEGNGHTISNLTINRPNANNVGLFGYASSSSKISNIGLLNVDIDGDEHVGGLVGRNNGTITNSYATGSVDGFASVGGLVGAVKSGGIANSYAAVSVNTISNSTNIGGLVGYNSGSITSSYATGSVVGSSRTGGLVGHNDGTIAGSYATGSIFGGAVGNLVGLNNGTITNSYWNRDANGDVDTNNPTQKDTTELQSPTTATGIYASWNNANWDFGTSGQLPILKYAETCVTTTTKAVTGRPICDAFLPNQGIGLRTLAVSVDNVVRLFPVFSSEQSQYIADTAPNTKSINLRLRSYDSAAVFEINKQGDDTDYFSDTAKSIVPVSDDDVVTIRVAEAAADPTAIVTTAYTLRIGIPAPTCGDTTDIDRDDDGLIEICDIEGLDAIRYQLDGTGYRASVFTDKITAGCKVGGCNGYELVRDLDFNDDTSYISITGKVIYTTGFGWQPIGDYTDEDNNNPFTSIFEGNGHTISNLTINRSNTNSVGLFRIAAGSFKISNIGLLNVDVEGSRFVGSLVGLVEGGNIVNSYATGSVDGFVSVGGLVGAVEPGSIANSYAAVVVNAISNSTNVGGLVGFNAGSITSSYAAGAVNGNSDIGGLVGWNFDNGSITSSYAIGSVVGSSQTGGLVGRDDGGSVANSYWDTQTSGRTTSAAGIGKTTAELQTPTTATDIYSSWNTANWDFGTSGQLPILKYAEACTTTAPKEATEQPICDAFLPYQGIGLRTLEALTSGVVVTPIFSSMQSGYLAGIPPSTSSIDLRLQSYDTNANFEIKKQEDNTNYFTSNEKSTISVEDEDILTIQVTEASATVTTTTSYTLQIKLIPTLTTISVTEDGSEDTDNTVTEGSDITLSTIASGGSEGYTYKWTQTSGKTLAITSSSTTAAISIKIPDDYIGSANTTASVTFTIMVTNDQKFQTLKSKTLTIMKQDNGSLVLEFQEQSDTDGTRLTAVVTADDPDGNPDPIPYQWQRRVGDTDWLDIAGANAGTYVVPKTVLYAYYRVRIDYTDGQGYDTRLAIGNFLDKVCDYTTDIDQDDDGLIEICDLEGLNAIRYQLDGSGYKASADADKITTGCKAGGCNGYELIRDLDFNDDPSYSSTANKVAWTVADRQDSADRGWQPIGYYVNNIDNNPFNSIFEGNGHTISNLTINRPNATSVGLFSYTGSSSKISNIGLLNVDIDGNADVGGLAGRVRGSIMNSYASGSVEGNRQVGGLAGTVSNGSIANSYASGSVNGNLNAGGNAGGLVGLVFNGSIANSYASGSVNGNLNIGGLVGGFSSDSIENSYATGSVGGNSSVGGLVGFAAIDSITNSYWDTEASGILTSATGIGRTTAALQSPTAATGIYGSWSAANWDFGTAKQLPILKYANTCTTTTAEEIIGRPICGTFLPHQGTGLRDLEALTSGVVMVPLLPVFGAQRDYVIDIPPSTNSIDLRLQSYDADANFEINKQGDNTNYFIATEKSTIPVNDGDVLTIQVTEAGAATTGTITNYMLRMNVSPVLLSGISVTETADDGTEDTDDTVSEGSDITLSAIAIGGSGGYQYGWTHTAANALNIPDLSAPDIRIKIPDAFIKSADRTISVTFTLTVTDNDNDTVTASKTLTIEKKNNGNVVMELQEESATDGTILTAVVTADDPDRGQDTNAIDYQWQEKAEDSGNWTNIASAANTKTYVVTRTPVDMNYRVRIDYTDGQGYDTRLAIGDFLYKVPCDYATDIDRDDDGLIEICNLEGLDAIRYQLDGRGYRTSSTAIITTGCKVGGCNGYELTSNLDFNDHASYLDVTNKATWTTGEGWQPIGSITNNRCQHEDSRCFTAIFEGNGHTISNLMIDRPDADYVGLFGYTADSSKISNVGLLNVDINGDSRTGGLVGENSGTIANSYVGGSIEGNNYVGGLVGQSNAGSIANSYATSFVGGNNYVGGLVGQSGGGSVASSYAGGRVGGSGNHVGGLVGENSGAIANSYAGGSIDGNNYVGGLVGRNLTQGSITSSHATGTVDGITNAGGLVGLNSNGSIANSFGNADLQSPTTATGIYDSWSTANWDFGTSGQLPILQYSDACTTATPKRRIGQPICGVFLPHQGVGLRTLEALVGNVVVPLVPVFSSEQSAYIADIPSSTDSIDLRLQSYDFGAAFEIKKQGDNTDYFTAERSTIPVSRNDNVTIQVTGAAADSAATTTTSYTLRIGFHPITLSAISVAEDPAINIEDADNTDDTVNEGSVVALSTIGGGGSGDYTYRWTQTSGKRLAVIGSSTATTLNFEIPDDFVLSADTTDSVEFTMTATDTGSNNVAVGSASKTLTIVKQNNGNISAEFQEKHNMDGTMLTIVVTPDDPDGNPDTIDYQWQKQTRGSMQWMDISGADTNIYEVLPTTTSISYRVIAEYTDGQGYETELEIGEFLYKAFCDYATNVDRDADGLIEVCDLEGLNAIRYQPDGSGYKASAVADIITTGCPDDDCDGYELTGNLDLSEVDNWLPIYGFAGIFEGNGHTISNLKINHPHAIEVGLFATTIDGSEINNVGLLNVDIEGHTNVGGLVGRNSGSVANSYAIGAVAGNFNVGGLVAENNGSIANSYVIGTVAGNRDVGGLVAENNGSIANSYVIGTVTGDMDVGGLVAKNNGSIAKSYAIGTVAGNLGGGLVAVNNGSIANSYWDADKSEILTSATGTSKTTVELQMSTEAGSITTEIYYGWNTNDWSFGTSAQLPILKYAEACTTTTPKAATGQPICNAFLPYQGTGLRTLEVLTSGVAVPLVPVFSSEQSEYIADTPPNTNSIDLRLESYDADAAFEIKKQGDNTDYFSDPEKSTILASNGDVVTIEVTGAAAGSAATTLTSYTLRIGFPPITLGAISVAENPVANIEDADNTDNTVNEGSAVTLSTISAGGSGDHTYQWMQTLGRTLAITGSSTSTTLNLEIPEDYVLSANTTASVEFTMTVKDAGSNNIAMVSVSKVLTIVKQENGDPIITTEARGRMLSVVGITDADDYDDDATNNIIIYRWQSLNNGLWTDINGAGTATYEIPPTSLGLSHRVIATYTDDQGHEKEAIAVYASSGVRVQIKVFPEGLLQ